MPKKFNKIQKRKISAICKSMLCIHYKLDINSEVDKNINFHVILSEIKNFVERHEIHGLYVFPKFEKKNQTLNPEQKFNKMA